MSSQRHATDQDVTEWRVLGAGSILPRVGYGCSGYALRIDGARHVTLFDCGPGTLRALGEAGFGVADVRRVVISHFHPDHVLDLFALAFARRNPALADAPRLEIVGPRGLADFVQRGAALYPSKSWTRFEDASVHEIEPARSERFECDDFALRWIANGHTSEAVSWRIELPCGRSIAYSGDTGDTPAVAEIARGVDLFVCECSFPDEAAVPNHLTPSSAARLAREAACAKLVLTHFYPDLDPEAARAVASRIYSGPVELARDGSVHRVEPNARTMDRRRANDR
jgi:ribonuclease BN (tRNA processing enzyme)